jgi:hypothetical protein
MACIARVGLHSREPGQDDRVKGHHRAENGKDDRSDPSKDGHEASD